MRGALDWAAEFGVTTNKKYPFLAYNRGSCFWDPVMNSFWFRKAEIKYSLPEDQIINLLRERVLLAEITIGPMFKAYRGGIYGTSTKELNDCKNGETFSVAIVGCYTNSNGYSYYRIRNAWGQNWGYVGHMKLIYGQNACGIRTTTAYPVPNSH